MYRLDYGNELRMCRCGVNMYLLPLVCVSSKQAKLSTKLTIQTVYLWASCDAKNLLDVNPLTENKEEEEAPITINCEVTLNAKMVIHKAL